MKRTVPLIITAVSGLFVITTFFIPSTESWGNTVYVWFDILAAVAFVLGGGNLLKQNLQKISDRKEGWGFAAITIVSFFAVLILGMLKVGITPSPKHPHVAWSGTYDQEGGALWWAYHYLYTPLTGTMFSLLAFFIASAAFRAFRAKNTEAIILLSTAFIVLLGRTSAGVFLTSWLPDSLAILRFDNLTDLIMIVFNTAGMRAIMIGIALGIVSTSLKVLLGIDRSYLGSDKG